MAPADEEEVELAGVDPDRHAQGDEAGAGPDPADGAQRPLHRRRGPRGPNRVVLPVEEEQDRVATPFHEPGAVVVGRRQQLGEAGVQRVVELLGSHFPLAGQALRHLREARDVDEGEGPADGLPALLRIVAQPFDQ